MSIGIALGSGSARGWAHIGVLEALHEEGIHPEFVAGTSIGSLVGAAYAAGNLASLKQAALDIDLRQIIYYFVQPSIPRSGLVDGGRVAEFLRKNIGAALIEELGMPYRAIAADMLSGEEVVFDSGDLIEAIRSSISMPGIFTPVYCQGRVLVDGGIVNPVPVEHVRALGAEKVIAVDINHGLLRKAEKSIPADLVAEASQQMEKVAAKAPKLSGLARKLQQGLAQLTPARLGGLKKWLSPDPVPNIFDVISNTVRIMQEQITESRLQIHPADVLIRPKLGDIGLLEFNNAGATIQAGYDAARKALDAGGRKKLAG